MKKFDKIKTIQLVLFVALTVFALGVIIRNKELYHMIATDPNVRILCIVLWIVLLISFIFMFIDFSSYSNIKREYSELDLAVFSDPLTGVANRYSCDAFIEQYLDKPLPADIGCITFDMTNLQEINANHGHVGGNNAIREFSSILQAASAQRCFVGRNGGNKFIAIFTDCTKAKMDEYLAAVESKVERHNMDDRSIEILYRYGIAYNEGSAIKMITELIALSDRRARQS